MTRKSKSKSCFVVMLSLSFVFITSFAATDNGKNEGHDHDSSEHVAEEVDGEHEDHSEHGHDEADKDHKAHDHGDTDGDHENSGDANHSKHDEKEDHEGHEDHDDHSDHSDKITLSEKALKLFDLKIEPVRRQNLYRKITAPARVTFNIEDMAHVGATVSGRVSDIRYRIGDKVRKGEVLLVLNSPQLGMVQSDFLQKLSEIEVARITLEVAETEYKRAKILVEGKGISQAEFLRIKGRFKVEKSVLLTANATAQAAENNLHLLGMSQERVDKLSRSGEVDPVYPIFAPIDGEIIARKATIGEVVSPENDALMTIADLSGLWVIASVPDVKMRFVEVGARAFIRSDAIGADVLEGTVTYIAPALDERTRTGQIRIEVESGHSGLHPGMFGSVQIFPKGDEISNTFLAVPRSAVFTVEGGPAVFVMDSSQANVFEKRPVVIGPVIDDYVPVLSGLSAGERVVIDGGFILKAELGKEGAAHEH